MRKSTIPYFFLFGKLFFQKFEGRGKYAPDLGKLTGR